MLDRANSPADKLLYKGADSQVLIDRIEKATIALSSIPGYVEMKQWSKVIGVLTGPLGELTQTLGRAADLSDNRIAAVDKVKWIKKDLYAMSDGVSRKDQAIVLKYHAAATNDLVDFVKAL